MVGDIEYALLAANVYGNSRDVRHPQNTLPIPNYWTADYVNGTYIAPVVSSSGFMARVYQNENDEIVIAYAGTTDEEGKELLDWINGNIPAATAAYFPEQVLEAAKFYLDVRSAAQGATITFTGHSLANGQRSQALRYPSMMNLCLM